MRISDWSSDVCSSDLQGAAFYSERNPEAGTISAATQLQGKELSYNNIADADAALECVKAFAKPACVIVNQAHPCGVAVNESGIRAAYERAYRTDTTSPRTEERRVGEECVRTVRVRGWQSH